MAILLIDYAVDDFAEWKSVFDRDPMDRSSQGVTGDAIFVDSADPNHFMLRMDFNSAADAEAFREALRPMWEISGAKRGWVLHDGADVLSGR